MGKIVALGGGVFMGKEQNLFPKAMLPIHQEIISLAGKKKPSVLFIPTAADDSEERIRGFQDYYSTELGCRVAVLRLLNRRHDKADLKTKVEQADIVYVTGGNTFRTIATWKRLGVDSLLKAAYEGGAVMAGHSAGAIAWFSYGNSDSFYKQKPFRVTALGIINALLCPHYDSEPVRQPALKKMMKRTYKIVSIVLDEYAAIEIIDGKYRFLTAKSDAQVRRAYWQANKYVVEELKPSKDYRSLESLLKKA